MEWDYYTVSLPAWLSHPVSNEAAFTWLPCMDFRGLTPLDPYDLAVFNAILLYNEPWQHTTRGTMVCALDCFFTACIDLYAEFKTGLLTPLEAGPFFSTVFEYICNGLLPMDNGAKRMARLARFFTRAFYNYHSVVGRDVRREVVVDEEIFKLLAKISRFISMSTGAEDVFYFPAATETIHGVVEYNTV
ncbi:hypothetical protein F4677DRAFT_443797 [Hypoxylon crocopeplum]|nr:hypothetical protein F4677DRAFT_443797 [Hypoxylon crocopeplum]